MSPRHRVLAGLPPYGPMPEQFSATGQGMHREGLVVAFAPPDAPPWVGNFQRGVTRLDVLVPSQGDTTVTVIAGGHAYVIDPASRACLRTFGVQIDQVLHFVDRTVFSNGLWLEATDGERLLWQTRRLSWDGIVGLHVEGDRIVGRAYDPMNDGWTPFSVGVANGDAVGGSYPTDLP